MVKFIELQVAEADEVKTQLVNVDNIGRIYPDPQNTRRCIVELNYQSVHDSPVFLEVQMSYESLRAYFL